MDIPKILSLQDGEFIYPLPQIKNIAVHPNLNLAVLLFTVKYSQMHAFSFAKFNFTMFFFTLRTPSIIRIWVLETIRRVELHTHEREENNSLQFSRVLEVQQVVIY